MNIIKKNLVDNFLIKKKLRKNFPVLNTIQFYVFFFLHFFLVSVELFFKLYKVSRRRRVVCMCVAFCFCLGGCFLFIFHFHLYTLGKMKSAFVKLCV